MEVDRMLHREGVVMRLVCDVIVVVALGLLLTACPSSETDDDTTVDDDSAADDDTAGDDDTGYQWEGEYQVVRICGCDGGDPGNPGPDIDAVLIRRDTDGLGYASMVTASLVPSDGNGHPDPEDALGTEDGEYVSVGGEGSYLDLRFSFEEVQDVILPSDLISLFELDDGSGLMETYQVLVSYDGSPGTWVNTETAVGAIAVGVHEPSYFMEGCGG